MCITIGTRRNLVNRRNGVREKKFGDRDGNDISVQGVLGEYAFRKMLRLPVDDLWDTTPRNFLNDSFDATIPMFYWAPEGQKYVKRNFAMQIDVKCVIKSSAPGLLVQADKMRKPADMYVLMYLQRGTQVPSEMRDKLPFTVDEDITAWFEGFALPVEVFQEGNAQYREDKDKTLSNGQQKKYYMVTKEHLHTWEEFEHYYLTFVRNS